MADSPEHPPASAHAAAPVPPAEDEYDGSRLILRDGTVASVRATTREDAAQIARFFRDLSPDARRNRFLGSGQPGRDIIDRLADSSDPRQAFTLIALRHVGEDVRVIAVASYFALTSGAAEASFAVNERFQGKGIGTLLLERLAAHAARAGFATFHASMLTGNAPMREVFRDSGFDIRASTRDGVVELELQLQPSVDGVAAAERRRRRATAESIRPLLMPGAVAVIGASRDPHRIGGRVVRALQAGGFAGRILPVNPHAPEIAGLQAYPSARDLPSGVDLAIVAVPAEAVLAAVDDCAAASVRSLVVITAGFAEIGPEGRARQNALTERVRAYGMRMIGPNCMGLLNMDPAVRLNASFSPVCPPAGGIAFSSQSGALGIAILRLAAARQIGLSAFVSVGNKADVSSNDLLEYWELDPQTRVILLYLESFGNPRRFARIARRVARTKPIVALKAGRSKAGSRAAGSHTAALAARDVAVDALFRQTGVIRVDTIDEMFDVAACLDAQPPPPGTRVGIVTNAGGPGILAVDACEASGLQVPELAAETQARLRAFLPPTASVGNPVDMIASAGPKDYRGAVETMLGATEIDSLIVVFTPIDEDTAAAVLSEIQAGVVSARERGIAAKPVLACLLSDSRDRGPVRAGRETIPTYAFPENAARALGRGAAYAAWQAQPAGIFRTFDDLDVERAREICRAAIARGDTWLDDQEVWDVLGAFGFPVAAHRLARTADEAAAFAEAIGFPVAAKLASTRVTHKTELGAVRLNLTTAEAVRRAFEDIVSRVTAAAGEGAVDGILIQPMVTGGIETLIGVTHDPTFGPLVAFGMGGINVEALGDVRFRVAPLTDRDADDLIRDVRGFPLLLGHRGRSGADLDALRDVLLRTSSLAAAVPEILELDLNPVMALAPGHGCRVVDARIAVAAEEARTSRARPRRTT
ncbi:MAG TPA: GNAT family N-acetyltransferase [Vicinamibacterales bacterium]|nr:GNAT family N-acetyltransferase [Vicinamibacterales bacterium]